ncbi:hypothetical protein [Desulfogranum japonicum]|uniref:hypothetical protein n=1 Tax=Desulfogranum japonicum TaxID=231447 RepID=UPI00041CBB0C|nr:hypothetical protein [Desulfogranum japonicum]
MNVSYDFFVPSAKEYVKALKSVKKQLSDDQRKMLEAHYRIFNHSITFGQFAELIGANGYQVALDAYEDLGRLLGEKLNMDFLESVSRPGEPLCCSAIGSGNPYRKEDESYFLVMHKELVEALRLLKWFK